MGNQTFRKTIEHKNNADILSDGIVKGSIQIPGNGQPIIMMSDHQTTGGYTKIATVASVDYSKLSRLRPGTKISFVSVNQLEASNLFLKNKNKCLMMKLKSYKLIIRKNNEKIKKLSSRKNNSK